MIINIRGTSGSGKSHLVREVMNRCAAVGPVTPHFEPGRRRPFCYSMTQPSGRPLTVVGHYETPCGGCDTIPSMDKIYNIVRQHHFQDHDVLYEGLLISAEVARAVKLSAEAELAVILLKVPLDVCLDSVNQRRWAKDPFKPPVNPKNTEAKWKQSMRAMDRLRVESSAACYHLLREEALSLIEELLRWPSPTQTQ